MKINSMHRSKSKRMHLHEARSSGSGPPYTPGSRWRLRPCWPPHPQSFRPWAVQQAVAEMETVSAHRCLQARDLWRTNISHCPMHTTIRVETKMKPTTPNWRKKKLQSVLMFDHHIVPDHQTERKDKEKEKKKTICAARLMTQGWNNVAPSWSPSIYLQEKLHLKPMRCNWDWSEGLLSASKAWLLTRSNFGWGLPPLPPPVQMPPSSPMTGLQKNSISHCVNSLHNGTVKRKTWLWVTANKACDLVQKRTIFAWSAQLLLNWFWQVPPHHTNLANPGRGSIPLLRKPGTFSN